MDADTLLVLGPTLFCWLLVGHLLLSHTVNLVRYAYGVAAIVASLAILQAAHNQPADVVLIVSTAGAAGVYTAVLYGAEAAWQAHQLYRAEGDLSVRRLRELTRRCEAPHEPDPGTPPRSVG